MPTDGGHLHITKMFTLDHCVSSVVHEYKLYSISKSFIVIVQKMFGWLVLTHKVTCMGIQGCKIRFMCGIHDSTIDMMTTMCTAWLKLTVMESHWQSNYWWPYALLSVNYFFQEVHPFKFEDNKRMMSWDVITLVTYK